MNCQQLALVLDECELHELPGDERAAAREHLDSCAECASDHDMHLRVAALPIAPLGEDRIAAWRALASPEAMAARVPSRGPRRLMLAGTLVAAVAAAALLVTALRGEPDAAPVLATSLPVVPEAAPAAAIPAAADPVPADPVPAAVEAPRASRPSSPPYTMPVVRSLTLVVHPLQYESEDTAVQAAVQRFYDALVQELRALPAVTVVGPRPADESDAGADFVLAGAARDHASSRPAELAGELADAAGQWRAMLRLRIQAADYRGPQPPPGSAQGSRGFVQPIRIEGFVSEAACRQHTATNNAVCDPGMVVRSSLAVMRMAMFPADAALQGELRDLLLDTSRPEAERGEAMALLALLAGRRGQGLDADVVHAALALVGAARDDATRLDYWRKLRGLTGPEVVGALVDATSQQRSSDLRLEAASQLAARFADDATASAALQWLAQNDPDARVRQAAQAVRRPAPAAATGF